MGGRWSGINRQRKARARSGVPGASMTRPERAWGQRLELALRAGEILWYGHQALTLRLAARCTYTPDFVVVERDGLIRLDEVKGRKGWELDDEGRTKWKLAGELYPWLAVQGVAQRADGGWEAEAYEPHGAWPRGVHGGGEEQ